MIKFTHAYECVRNFRLTNKNRKHFFQTRKKTNFFCCHALYESTWNKDAGSWAETPLNDHVTRSSGTPQASDMHNLGWKMSSDCSYRSGYVRATLKCGNRSKQANANEVCYCPNKMIIKKFSSFHTSSSVAFNFCNWINICLYCKWNWKIFQEVERLRGLYSMVQMGSFPLFEHEYFDINNKPEQYAESWSMMSSPFWQRTFIDLCIWLPGLL